MCTLCWPQSKGARARGPCGPGRGGGWKELVGGAGPRFTSEVLSDPRLFFAE